MKTSNTTETTATSSAAADTTEAEALAAATYEAQLKKEQEVAKAHAIKNNIRPPPEKSKTLLTLERFEALTRKLGPGYFIDIPSVSAFVDNEIMQMILLLMRSSMLQSVWLDLTVKWVGEELKKAMAHKGETEIETIFTTQSIRYRFLVQCLELEITADSTNLPTYDERIGRHLIPELCFLALQDSDESAASLTIVEQLMGEPIIAELFQGSSSSSSSINNLYDRSRLESFIQCFYAKLRNAL